MSKTFQVICCDPPYAFNDKLNNSSTPRGAEANYTTMTNADIMALPVKQIADPDGCILALWCPSSLMQVGLDVMKAWGFEQKTTYIWVKTKKEPIKSAVKANDINDILGFGMGRTFRASHELALIGINNTGIYKQLENKSQRSVSLAENLGHSTKPEMLQDSLELMFPKAKAEGKLVELFARRARPDWVCLGNECPSSMGEDIRVSLQRLIDG